MQEDHFRDLLKKYTQGKCSAEEIAWLESGYLKWNEAEKSILSDQQLTDAANLMRKHVLLHTQPAIIRALWPRIAGAASVLIVLSVGLLLYNKTNKPVSIQQTLSYSTAQGQKKNIVLPDGSKITLNGASILTLSHDFNQKDRHIDLVGEAYFDIVHNANKPFTVHTKNVDIKDIGTIFNIKAYAEDQYIEASLIEGAIELTAHDKKTRPILLSPKQKAIVQNPDYPDMNPETHVQTVHTEPLKIINITSNPKDKTIAETDWVNNRLTFNDESFEVITTRMERWYNVKISFEKPALKKYRFVGTFTNQSATDVLDVLKQSRDFNYRKEGNVINIY